MLKRIFQVPVILASAALSACSPINVLNAWVPESEYVLVQDVAYGEQARHRLDIYLPKSPSDVPRPTVLFFYGGSWQWGDRHHYKFVGEALASAGIIAVIADYRVYPEVVFPGFMHDAAAAFAWTQHHIDTYGGVASQVFVAGHSAGAHIATLLALDSQYLAAQGFSADAIRGVIGLAGPYDFLPITNPTLQEVFGEPAQWWRSQPIAFVRPDAPPMLLMVGERDMTVWPRNTHNLARALREQGAAVEVVSLDLTHVFMVAKLAKPLRGDGALLRPVLAFVQAQRQQDVVTVPETSAAR